MLGYVRGYGGGHAKKRGSRGRDRGAGSAALAAAAGPGSSADAQSSFAGTYKGSGTGVDKKGKKASSGATVWVEDQGDTVRFTFRFDRLPVVVAAEGPVLASKTGGTVVRVSIKESGIRGSATLSLIPKGQTWVLVASGKGKALTYEGSGRLACVRTTTGVDLPSTRKQVEDLFSALTGGVPASSTKGLKKGAGNGGSGATGQTGVQPPVLPTPEVTVKPTSALAPAKPKPPVLGQDALETTGVLLAAKGKDHQLVGYGEAGKVLMTIPPLRPEATSLPLP